MSVDLAFAQDGLQIEATASTQGIMLTFTGEVSMSDPASFLSPYLERALQTAKANDVALVLDFSSLSFMNSSSLVPVVEAVRRMGEAGVAGRLVYRRSVSWQRVSYQCMKVLANVYKHVQVEYTTDPPRRI